MAKEFFDTSPYRNTKFDRAAIEFFLLGLIHDDGGLLLVSKEGFLAGILTPLVFAPDILIANEIAWWSRDGAGAELREAFESWADNMRASGSMISTLNNNYASKLGANLMDNGYSPIEVRYLKALG